MLYSLFVLSKKVYVLRIGWGIQKRCRKLLIQICGDVQILKGVVNKCFIHMHIKYLHKISAAIL